MGGGGFDGHLKVQFHLERSRNHICQISLSERVAAGSIVVGFVTLILFPLRLSCRLRQSTAVWPGRQEPPIALQMQDESFGTFRKGFQHPHPPPPPPPPPQPLFLITHYPIPVSGREFHKYFQAAWMRIKLRV